MIYVMADIHSMPSRFIELSEQIENLSEQDTIIIAGDCGLGFGRYVQTNLRKFMASCPANILVMRGNHDGRYWDIHRDATNGEIENGWYLDDDLYGSPVLIQKKYPNIHYVRDEGGIYDIEGYEILFIPGGYSVDADYRQAKGLPYEINEKLTYKEMYRLLDAATYEKDDIDFVIAHTAPKYLEGQLQYLFLDFIDQEKVDKSMEEGIGIIMSELLEGKCFKQYVFGHYHDDRRFDKYHTMIYNKVICLNDWK